MISKGHCVDSHAGLPIWATEDAGCSLQPSQDSALRPRLSVIRHTAPEATWRHQGFATAAELTTKTDT